MTPSAGVLTHRHQGNWQHKHEARELKGMVYCENSLCEESGVEQPANADLLQLDVDVLVLAGLENQITEQNAHAVQASAILEIANGPVTSEADRILEDRGIAVLSDVLVNSSGVIVSYMEWVQNRSGDYWSEDEMSQRLNARLAREANACFERATQEQP